MTNRRAPAQRTGKDWKPPRPRDEIPKAVGAAAAVVLLTALAIFVMKPGDSGTSVPSQIPVTSTTLPTGTTATTAVGGATGTTGTTGGGSENGSTTSVPGSSTTTAKQP